MKKLTINGIDMLERYCALKKELGSFLGRFEDEFVETPRLTPLGTFTMEHRLPNIGFNKDNPQAVMHEAIMSKALYPYLYPSGLAARHITDVIVELGDPSGTRVVEDMMTMGRQSVFQQRIPENVVLGMHPRFRSILIEYVGPQNSATVPRLISAIEAGPPRNPVLTQSLFVGLANEYDKDHRGRGVALIFLDPQSWASCFGQANNLSYADRLRSFTLDTGL